jgi:hypothetical protein
MKILFRHKNINIRSDSKCWYVKLQSVHEDCMYTWGPRDLHDFFKDIWHFRLGNSTWLDNSNSPSSFLYWDLKNTQLGILSNTCYTIEGCVLLKTWSSVGEEADRLDDWFQIRNQRVLLGIVQNISNSLFEFGKNQCPKTIYWQDSSTKHWNLAKSRRHYNLTE